MQRLVPGRGVSVGGLVRVALLLCACTAASAQSRATLREQLQLAVWHDGSRDALRPLGDLLRAAQETRPGLIITLQCYPSSGAYRQLQEWSAPGARGAPDLVVVRDQWLPAFARSLQPLNALLPARELTQVPESVKSRLRHSGNLYGVPWQLDARALLYRPDVLKAAGVLPPRTWAELVVAARRCHNPPQLYGFGLPGIRDDAGAELLLQLLWAHGADLPPVGEPGALAAEALTAVLQTYSDLHAAAEPEVLSWDQESLEELFLAGRLAMLIGPRALQEHMSTVAGSPPCSAVPLPTGSAEVGYIDLDLVSVWRGTSHLPAALSVLRALTTERACEGLVKMGSLPFRLDVAARYRLDPAYAAYVARLEQSRGLPAQRWSSARPVLSDGLFYLLSGRQTVAQAVAALRQRFAQGETLAPRANGGSAGT